MQNKNPYVIGFGVRPDEYIPLDVQQQEVIDAFNEKNSKRHAFVIVGVRGSGKTVLMNEISNNIGKGWIIIDLSSQGNLLESLTSQLYSDISMHALFLESKIDLSFMGIGARIEAVAPAMDYQTAITRMLQSAKKHGKKILVKIDEVSNTQQMRDFASKFQIFIGKDLPIFLIMAGVPENVKGLTEDKTSTFLLRTPKIEMRPLNITSIKRSYESNLGVSEKTASELAKLTQGYAFAYQVLGNVSWNKYIDINDPSFKTILGDYDRILQEYSYYKLWEEASSNEKRILKEMAALMKIENNNRCKVCSVRDRVEMDSAKFSVYRDRLMRKGLVDGKTYGEVAFSLPRFQIFVEDQVY